MSKTMGAGWGWVGGLLTFGVRERGSEKWRDSRIKISRGWHLCITSKNQGVACMVRTIGV